MRRQLTDAFARQAPKGITMDTECRKLGIRVQRGAGVFVLRVPAGAGRSRWITLGTFGDFPESEGRDPQTRAARAKAQDLLAELGSGVDIAARRDKRKACPDLVEFAKRYIREYSYPHKKASTMAADLGLLGLTIERDANKQPVLDEEKKPIVSLNPEPGGRTILSTKFRVDDTAPEITLGALKVDQITSAPIAKFHADGLATPYRANRHLALLSHMLGKLAVIWEYRTQNTNPCFGLPKYDEEERECVLTPEELGRLGAAFSRVEEEATKAERYPYAVAALRLLLLTGARESEILGLRWAEVDRFRELSAARLLDSKTGKKTLFFNPLVLELLEDVPRVEGNPFVIVGRLKGRSLTVYGLNQIWQGIRAEAGLAGDEAAGVLPVRIHDLRHNYGSIAAMGGAEAPTIAKLLGHSQLSTTNRYIHFHTAAKVAASTAVAAPISAALGKPRLKAVPK